MVAISSQTDRQTASTGDNNTPNTASSQQSNINLPDPEMVRFGKEMGAVSDAIVQAKKQGKPVLVVVGLLHESTQNTNMGVYLMAMVHGHHGGLKNLFIETNDESVSLNKQKPLGFRMENPGSSYGRDPMGLEVVSQKDGMIVMSSPRGSLGIDPFDIMQPIASGLGVETIGIDTFQRGELSRAELSTGALMDKRDELMLENIDKNIKPGVSIAAVGSLHLPFFLKNKDANEKYTIVPVLLPAPKVIMENSAQEAAADPESSTTMWRHDALANNTDMLRISSVNSFNGSGIGTMISQFFPRENHSSIASSLAPDIEKIGELAGKKVDLSDEKEALLLFGLIDNVYNQHMAEQHMDSLKQLEMQKEVESIFNVIRKNREGELE